MPKKNPAAEAPKKLMADAIKVPFAKALESLATDNETEDESEKEEESNFEKAEIWITKKLLESMESFDDPKRAQTYKERSATWQLVKFAKRYDAKALEDIESDEELFSYIQAICFEWLLNHSEQEVPVIASREFFSTFRFKATVDPDADSISFRLFYIEHLMSIREWSLCLGLFRNEEDEDGIWNEKMIGVSRNTPGLTPQTAWEAITHRKCCTFKTNVSKGFHILNPLLGFAQEFIGYNLMGTSSSALTTTVLYFAWCMSKKIKVHLGYWLAQACHSMTANPSRHLHTCHLLGAYIQRNFIMKIAKAGPNVLKCDAQELFSVKYFFNKNLLYTDGGVTCFYEIG